MRVLLPFYLAVMVFCNSAIVHAQTPRPEYPFPQMQRAEWLNLNGKWEFAETDDANAEATYLGASPYPEQIVVPYCRESKLSGLAHHDYIKNVWYRRTFQKPAGWKSPRVLLHVGACDYLTQVWVNGKPVGEHMGGSASFAFDITPYLVSGDNTLTIHAFDDLASGLQPGGKQSVGASAGCSYTRTTGIWQTVWLEGVGATYVKDAYIRPDPVNSRISIDAQADGPCPGLTIRAIALAAGKEVGRAEAPASPTGTKLVLKLKTNRVWTVSDPFLYDLKLALLRGGKVVDAVNSYFGQRAVTIKGAAILINGKAIFMRTVLDQGFYPDGIWTAPTDADLKRDIMLGQACGFNGARLHQKVFDPRYLYWADKLGYLVWGEFPSWGMDFTKKSVDEPVKREWAEVVVRDRNHPAIIGWCPFNESPGEAIPLQNAVVALTRPLDPTRPIIDASGWSHGLPDPQVLDAHDYEGNPVTYRARWTEDYGPGTAIPTRYVRGEKHKYTPFFISEYGGIAWDLSNGGWGYGEIPKTLDQFYTRYKGLTDALLDARYIFGYCYTQIYDVEQEHNGLYRYDRTPKFDVARLRKINSRPAAYEKNPPVKPVVTPPDTWKVLVGAAVDGDNAARWGYTINNPGDSWMKSDFDYSEWKPGYGGFGQLDGWESLTHVPWKSKDIWMRNTFEYTGPPIKEAVLVIVHDDMSEVYLNGELVKALPGWTSEYRGYNVTAAVKASLKSGINVIAIHTHQDEGGQYIDAGLLVK